MSEPAVGRLRLPVFCRETAYLLDFKMADENNFSTTPQADHG